MVPGVDREFTSDDADRLGGLWEPYNYSFHTAEWWKTLCERCGCVKVERADTMPEGHKVWLHWDKTLKEAGILKRHGDVELLESDGGNLTFVRIVAIKDR